MTSPPPTTTRYTVTASTDRTITEVAHTDDPTQAADTARSMAVHSDLVVLLDHQTGVIRRWVRGFPG